ncbi:MAG: type II toxin-antitoxin system PemK/MazF family toxin [Parvularculaceae bacterium]
METYDRYDLALTLFPFSEKQGAKVRPVAILSAASFDRDNGCSICAMVTTAGQVKWPSDVPLMDYGAAGLRTPSVVRMKIFTLQTDRLAGRIGVLSRRDRLSLAAAVRSAFFDSGAV